MAQLTPIRGFVNTPVTRITITVLVVGSILVSMLQLKHFFHLILDPFITQFHQYWRLGIYQVIFTNESDLMIGVLLLFHFKVIERFLGSKPYLSLFSIFFVYNIAMCFLAVSLGQILINVARFLITRIVHSQFTFKTTIMNSVGSGLMGVLLSLYICYGYYIPVQYQFQILLKPDSPLVLTDHFQVHILYTLMMINGGIELVIPCLMGLFIGKLYVKELLPGRMWVMPDILFRLVVSPRKTLRRIGGNLRGRYLGYSGISEPVELVEQEQEPEVEQEQVVEDDTRNYEIRAETPVRPLARQVLDAFRSGTHRGEL